MLHAWRENVPGHRIRSVWWPLDLASPQKKKGKKVKKISLQRVLVFWKCRPPFFLWLYSFQPYHVLGLLQIYICEDANFIPDKVLVIEIIRIFLKLLLQRENTFSPDYSVLKGKYFNIIIYLTKLETRCLHSLYWTAKSKEQERILTTHETHSPQALLVVLRFWVTAFIWLS